MKKNIVFDRKKDFDTRGFTLVELLATIAVLSLIFTVVIYVVTGVVEDSKNKSYQVTVNNIEKVVSNYVLEYNYVIKWANEINANYDYQCVNVQELIDAGYFKNDILDSHISDSELVKADDYVYIERDGTTKSLTKNILLTGDIKNKYSGLCTNIKTDGNISFNVYPIDWAKEKIVKITYNLFNPNSVYDYTYSYIFDGVKNKNNFNNSSMVQEVKVTQQGTVNASIDKGTKNITNASIAVSKIDNVNPYIEVKVVNGKTYSKSKDAEIIIKDNDSGFKVGEYEVRYDWSTTGKTCNQLTKKAKIEIKDNNIKSGTVKIKVNSGTGPGKLYVCGVNLSDYVGNIYNSVVSSEMYLDNTPPTVPIIYNPTNGNWTNQSIVLNVSTVEEHSGVDNWQYTYSSTASVIGNDSSTQWIVHKKSAMEKFTPAAYTDERNQYTYIRVCDKAGNCSSSGKTMIKIDKTNPSITFTPNGSSAYAKSVSSKITLSDNLSGGNVNSYKYIYSSSKNTTPSKTFTSGTSYSLSSNTGSYYLIAYGCDKAGNCSKKVSNVFNLDNKGPVIVINNYSGSSIVRGKVTIPLRVNDEHAGVDGNSFVVSDIVVTIGGSTINSGITLTKIDNNNYNLTIENYNKAGDLKIIINSGKVLDKLGNSNSKVELTPGVKFNNKYTISYKSNGGTGSMSTTTCVYGANCSLNNNGFSKTGYTLLSWNTKADGSGSSYSINYVFKPYNFKSDLTLYAQWKINTVTIKYNVNGGVIQGTNSGGTWTTSNGIILRNGSILTAKINYGASLGSDGLANYNNSTWVNVSKTGYSAVSGSQ